VTAALIDQFEDTLSDVKKPKSLCTPADKNGEGIRNPVDHLTGYQIKVATGELRHVPISGIHLNNRNYGAEVVATIKEEFLFVPSLKNPLALP
jgi:hypothetical protein